MYWFVALILAVIFSAETLDEQSVKKINYFDTLTRDELWEYIKNTADKNGTITVSTTEPWYSALIKSVLTKEDI